MCVPEETLISRRRSLLLTRADSLSLPPSLSLSLYRFMAPDMTLAGGGPRTTDDPQREDDRPFDKLEHFRL